ncbi:uncharacterized protein LOC144925618 isoform X1 [Branchiostoma floridae x Branchiostoma belcheri]
MGTGRGQACGRAPGRADPEGELRHAHTHSRATKRIHCECPSFTRHSLTRWTNSTIYRRTKTAVNFAKSILRCRLQQEFTTPSCGRIGVCMRVFHARKISIECSSIVAWVPSEFVTATGKFGWHPG